ncbi:MAG: MerR family transcriptional regulator [Gammaproteobacteria bacterium]|nr:MerR family transcriptional regulator [Gammaproteobacteria bacterium]
MNNQSIIINEQMESAQGIGLSLFPIRILAEKTSVGTSTLRAWERRYGLLHPQRTPKGHRLYSEEDAKRVFKILNLLDDGHSLAAIANMLSTNSKEDSDIAAQPDNGLLTSSSALSNVWQGFIHSSLDAVSDFNIERIDAIYNEASSLYPLDMVTERLILPTITQLGNAWKDHPERGIAEEHFYTSWLKNRLGARFHHAYSQAKGARIVCACLPGCYHEIGLMLFALSALSRGYRVLYFGADLPLNQLAHIAKRSAAKAIILSTQNHSEPQPGTELVKLIPTLYVPVFIGGADQLNDDDKIQQAGGIILGENLSVAMRVFESRVPAYTSRDHS